MQSPARICDSTGENSTSHSSHTPSAGRPVATHTHKRKSSRDTRSVQERHLTSERIRSQQQEVRDFLKFRTDEAVGKLYQNSLRRSFIRDCSLKSKEIRFLETKCEINQLGSRTERADDAICEFEQTNSFSSYGNLPQKSGYETSRREQSWLQAELQNRERTHQDARN